MQPPVKDETCKSTVRCDEALLCADSVAVHFAIRYLSGVGDYSRCITIKGHGEKVPTGDT